jgi:hypothetical protein
MVILGMGGARIMKKRAKITFIAQEVEYHNISGFNRA